MQEKKQQRIGTLQIILAGVAWSFAGLLGKWIPWSAFTLVGTRALVAALILGSYRRSFRPRFTRSAVLGGVGAVITSVLFMCANKLTSAANAIVLQYAMPAFVILLCWVMYRQKPKRRDVIAGAVVLLGVALCFCQGMAAGNWLGDGLALLSALSYAIMFFAARMPGADALDNTYLGTVMELPFLLAILWDPGFTVTPTTLGVGALMGICLGLGYLLFSVGMRRGVSPVAAGIVANVEPVLNPTWVFLFLHENPGTLSIVGAIVVLGAVTLYSITGSKTETN